MERTQSSGLRLTRLGRNCGREKNKNFVGLTPDLIRGKPDIKTRRDWKKGVGRITWRVPGTHSSAGVCCQMGPRPKAEDDTFCVA